MYYIAPLQGANNYSKSHWLSTSGPYGAALPFNILILILILVLILIPCCALRSLKGEGGPSVLYS